MKKIYRCFAAIFASLALGSAIIPPVAYASEIHYQISQQEKVNQAVAEVEKAIATSSTISEEQIDKLIEENRDKYFDLSAERMREIAHMVTSPYSMRASVLDGQGVTLSEFAFAFDVVVGGLITGYSNLGKYAAAKGVSAARAMMSRAAKAAAQRVGILSGFISRILGSAFAVINIYYNVGYALAQFIDARDYHPNNGRINAWA